MGLAASNRVWRPTKKLAATLKPKAQPHSKPYPNPSTSSRPAHRGSGGFAGAAALGGQTGGGGARQAKHGSRWPQVPARPHAARPPGRRPLEPGARPPGRRPQELGARPALRAAGRRRPGAVRLPASRDAAARLRLHCTPARGTPTASSQSGQGPGRQVER